MENNQQSGKNLSSIPNSLDNFSSVQAHKEADQESKIDSIQALNNSNLYKTRMAQWEESKNKLNKESLQKTINVTEQVDNYELNNLTGSQIEQFIHFNLISETKEISINESKNFVCGIQLQVKQPKEQRERIPIDLVIVIDDFGYMSSQKSQLVRKSLKYLLNIMNENDKICFISFDNEDTILTPFLRNNKENNNELNKVIQYVVGRGSTNILAGIETGIYEIMIRKEKNPVACMLLLSDSQDDSFQKDQRIKDIIRAYDIKDNLIVNAYCFGTGHDANQIRNITETQNCDYYNNIEDVKMLFEFFAISISGLQSAIGEEVKISIKSKDQKLSHLSVTQVYGGDQLWIKQDYKNGTFEIYLPHLIIGDNHFFVFNCQYTSDYYKLTEQNKSLDIFEADIEIRAVKDKQIIRKSDTLKLGFKDCISTKLKQNISEPYYEELMITYFRVLGGLKIKQATELIYNYQDYTQAKVILEDYKQLMNQKKENLSNSHEIKNLEEYLDNIINNCSPNLFRQDSFKQMEAVYSQRHISITNCKDEDKEQGEDMKRFTNKDFCHITPSQIKKIKQNPRRIRQNLKLTPKEKFLRYTMTGLIMVVQIIFIKYLITNKN